VIATVHLSVNTGKLKRGAKIAGVLHFANTENLKHCVKSATVPLYVNTGNRKQNELSAAVQRYVRPHYVKHKAVIKHTKAIVCGVL
jgi:hypothetical protein